MIEKPFKLNKLILFLPIIECQALFSFGCTSIQNGCSFMSF